jgi:hypothetical protein
LIQSLFPDWIKEEKFTLRSLRLCGEPDFEVRVNRLETPIEINLIPEGRRLAFSEAVHINQSKITQGADVSQGAIRIPPRAFHRVPEGFFFLKLLTRQFWGETPQSAKFYGSQYPSNASIYKVSL